MFASFVKIFIENFNLDHQVKDSILEIQHLELYINYGSPTDPLVLMEDQQCYYYLSYDWAHLQTNTLVGLYFGFLKKHDF